MATIEASREFQAAFRSPACLRDERVRALLTEARTRRIIDLRRTSRRSDWAVRVQDAQPDGS